MADVTSLTLLDRLQSEDHASSWLELQEVYQPLIRKWLTKYSMQEADVEDLVQEVMLTVSKEVGSFEHNGRTGAFRAWLRTILANRLLMFWRSQKKVAKVGQDSHVVREIEQLHDPASDLSKIWDRDHDQMVAYQLLQRSKKYFTPQTWECFRRFALEGEPAKEVAKRLKVSVNTVFIAKSRVLGRLRTEARGLVDSAMEIR